MSSNNKDFDSFVTDKHGKLSSEQIKVIQLFGAHNQEDHPLSIDDVEAFGAYITDMGDSDTERLKVSSKDQACVEDLQEKRPKDFQSQEDKYRETIKNCLILKPPPFGGGFKKECRLASTYYRYALLFAIIIMN